MNTAWEELVEGVREQGSRLGQAEAQTDYNRLTGDIKTKLGDLRAELGPGAGAGDDMRGCKKLLSQHAAAEAELAALEAKVRSDYLFKYNQYNQSKSRNLINA